MKATSSVPNSGRAVPMRNIRIHHVVVERDDKYMSLFNEMVPEFIEKMDEALKEIGFTFGEQWR